MKFFSNERVKIAIVFVVMVFLLLNEYVLCDLLKLPITFTIALAAFFYIASDVLKDGIKTLFKQKRMSEQLLMSIATVAAFALCDFTEALAIMFFYKIGEQFEDYAKSRSQKDIMSLVALKPTTARLVDNGVERVVKPREVKIGDTIKVLKGECIALDGVLLSEYCSLDTKSITGESKLYTAKKGDEILSGSINVSDVILVKVTKLFRNSSITKLLNLIEDAAVNKSTSETLIRRFSYYYTPIVVSIALILALVPVVITEALFSDWIERALIFLVVSCPCALVLSVPLTFFSGIGALSKLGILVKGSIHIETLSKLKAIAFDKTGTITKGEFSVSSIKATIPERDVYEIVYALEKNSTHPIAKSLVQKAKDISHSKFEDKAVENFKEIPGFGLEGIIDGQLCKLGSADFVKEYIDNNSKNTDDGYTRLYLIKGNSHIATICLSDEPKADAKALIDNLNKLKIETSIISGDLRSCVELCAKKIGIDKYFYENTPDLKLESFKEFKRENGITAFCGDGLNDAPVINLSDVSFAMGKSGSALSVESADIIIMNDSLLNVQKSIRISKRVYKLAKFNIAFVILIKILILLLGAFGFANIYLAIFADVGVLILAVLNAMRAMKFG